MSKNLLYPFFNVCMHSLYLFYYNLMERLKLFFSKHVMVVKLSISKLLEIEDILPQNTWVLKVAMQISTSVDFSHVWFVVQERDSFHALELSSAQYWRQPRWCRDLLQSDMWWTKFNIHSPTLFINECYPHRWLLSRTLAGLKEGEII